MKQKNEDQTRLPWYRIRLRTLLMHAAVVPALLWLNFRESFFWAGTYLRWTWGWPLPWYFRGGDFFTFYDDFVPLGVFVDLTCAIAIVWIVHWLSERSWKTPSFFSRPG